MPIYDELFSLVKEFLPFITTGGVVLSAAGLVPRIGPGRAAWIALRSRFAFKAVPQSLRYTELKLLKRKLAKREFGQSYLVVTGEKGVGKSCMISTVTSKTVGVINVKVPAGETEKIIVKDTLKLLTDPPFKFMDPLKSAPRVIFWFRLFTLGRSPIIVLEVSERKVGQEFADLTGAVRTLVEKYKLRVVVDGSPNSLDESLLRTTRQRVFDIVPMTKDMIWQLEQFHELFQYVKSSGLEDTVFSVLGGIPSRYEDLWESAEDALQDGQDIRQVIGNHLCCQIYDAIKLIKDSKTNSDTKKIISIFDRDKLWIRSDFLIDKHIKRPTPDKVFREVEQEGVPILIPASNAIGIVLRHSLKKKPTLEELEGLVKT